MPPATSRPHSVIATMTTMGTIVATMRSVEWSGGGVAVGMNVRVVVLDGDAVVDVGGMTIAADDMLGADATKASQEKRTNPAVAVVESKGRRAGVPVAGSHRHERYAGRKKPS